MIIRAMDWGGFLEKLPTSISKWFPKGNPNTKENKEKILLEIERLKILGPYGRQAMEHYMKNKDDEMYLENQLDNAPIHELSYESYCEYKNRIEQIQYIAFHQGFIKSILQKKQPNVNKNKLIQELHTFDYALQIVDNPLQLKEDTFLSEEETLNYENISNVFIEGVENQIKSEIIT